MNITDGKIGMAEVIKSTTMNVTVSGVGWFLFRVQCAVPFMWLAAKIAGIGFRVKLEDA